MNDPADIPEQSGANAGAAGDQDALSGEGAGGGEGAQGASAARRAPW